MNVQKISFANGITLSVTPSMKDQTLVYNAVGYVMDDPLDVVVTFKKDLSREELIKAIFDISGKDSLFELLVPYIEPYDVEDEDLTDGEFEQREARIMSLEDEFRGSFPSSIESEEQPY
jgi:hypothetical protein